MKRPKRLPRVLDASVTRELLDARTAEVNAREALLAIDHKASPEAAADFDRARTVLESAERRFVYAAQAFVHIHAKELEELMERGS